MSIYACGINHQTAPLQVREKIALVPEQLTGNLQGIVKLPSISEVAILSTCNRTEFYCEARHSEEILEWIKIRHANYYHEIEPYLYFHQEEAAVKHMMRVACGLDSMVLGEPQILGQMKSAFLTACKAGTIGKTLHRLFQTIFAVTKHVRTDTAIGASPISVAYASVDLAKKIFEDMSQSKVLLIGAGETIELAARYFTNQGVQKLMFANRTLEKAKQLAKRWNGESFSISEVTEYLSAADIVITATSSPLPILGKGSIESALKTRKRKPMLILDIAVPRNVEPEAGKLIDVFLYTVDDLKEVIQENLKIRQGAAVQAEHIIDFQAAHYMRTLQSLDSVPTIRAFREWAETFRDEEIAKALQCIERGQNPEEVLIMMARSLINKITHVPCTKMRQAAYEGQLDLLLLTQQLFDLK